MAGFKMTASDLFNGSNHKIATLKGNDIYDERNHKVATLRGSDIYDERNSKIASIGDAKKAIDGAMGGATVAALWLFFVRWIAVGMSVTGHPPHRSQRARFRHWAPTWGV